MSWTYVRNYEELYVYLGDDDIVDIDCLPMYAVEPPFLGVYTVDETAYGVWYDKQLTEFGAREFMDDFCLYVGRHNNSGIPF